MPPIRRHVHLIMDKDIYKKLGNDPDSEKAWRLLRCDVGKDIFGEDYVAVPHIESALYYNQLFVFRKEANPCSILRLRPPRFRIVNNLDNLLNIEFSTWIPQFDFSPWTEENDRLQLFSEFRMFMESAEDEDLPKSIKITLKELSIRNASAPVPGTTFLKSTSSRGTTFLRSTSARGHDLYVITSVVYANYVKIKVAVGPSHCVFINRTVLPIGFKYKKYKILANGQVFAELNTRLRCEDSEATWLRPNDIHLLRNPDWDPMRRRHDGRRPNKNIMTMSTTSLQPADRTASNNNVVARIPPNVPRNLPFLPLLFGRNEDNQPRNKELEGESVLQSDGQSATIQRKIRFKELHRWSVASVT